MRLESSMRTATDTTLRYLAMLSAIPVGLPGKSTSQIFHELRDKNPDFDVTRRTIQRSLEQLSQRFPSPRRRKAAPTTGIGSSPTR